MSLPTSIRAYDDCKTLYEAAALDPKGVRACLGTEGAAMGMRTRMNYYRKLDREANAEIYPSDHPMYNLSPYDIFVNLLMVDADGEWWLYVQPRTSKILAIEGLSEVPDLVDVDGEEVKLIEGPQT